MKALGNYALEGELGRGGMGVVFRARSPEGHVVAVKLLHAGMSRENVERFGREVRLLGTLGEAQGFVPLLDAGSSPQGPYLVMPFLEGGTLRDRLERGPLEVASASAIVVALARALGAAHSQGIVHRDLKPENVLFTQEGGEGRPLVADLGLAKHFSRDSALSISLSKTGELRGTVGYMAPEQMNDTKNVGPAADVFALGVMAYECLAGVPPFDGDTPHATFALTAAGKFLPLRRHRPEVPAALARVIERALAPDPARRFSDGAAFANALQAAASARGGSVPRGALALGIFVPALVTLLVLLGVRGAQSKGRGTTIVTAPSPPAPPVPPGPPPRTFPRTCAGFASSKHTRLASILGGYQGRHKDAVTGVAFSPDGRSLASVAADRDRILWDLEGDEVLRLPRADAKLSSVAFAPDGKTLLTGGHDGAIQVCSTATGDVLRTLKGDTQPVLAIAVSDDGKRAVAASAWSVRFWDMASGEAAGVAPFPFAASGATRAVSVSPDGARAVTGDADGSVHLWDLSRGEPIRAIAAHPGSNVLSVALSRDGAFAVSGGSDGLARVIDLERGEVVATLEGHDGPVHAVAISPDGRRVATGDSGRARVFEMGSGPPRKLWRDGGRRGYVSSIALAPGGRLLAGTVGEGACTVWDQEHEVEIGQLVGPGQGNVNAIAVSPDGRRALTVAHDRSIRLFDIETRALVWRTGGYFNNVLSVAFSSDGKLAISGSDEPLLRVLDVEQGREVARMAEKDMGWIASVGFLPGDERAFGIGHDGALRIWDIGRRELVAKIGGHPGTARAVLVPGTSRVVVANADGTVGICDIALGTEVARFEAHAKTEPRVAAFPDGRHAVTASPDDGSVKIWDLETRSVLDELDLSSAHDGVTALAVARDGKRLYLGTARGVVLGFDVKLP